MSYNTDLLIEELDKISLALSEKQIGQLIRYYEILIEKNKVMNLTAITEYEDVVVKHFVDSLCLCKVYDTEKFAKIMDLGTGAGFPGIPLKIAFPNLEILLADSLNKRIVFLDEVISELSLDGISAVHGRAEELGRNPLYREQFDVCVSRAVSNLSSLSEYCLPFVKTGGQFISYKSGDVEEELIGAKRAISILGGKIDRTEVFNIRDNSRCLIVIDKITSTKKAYPRKAGTPTKQPL